MPALVPEPTNDQMVRMAHVLVGSPPAPDVRKPIVDAVAAAFALSRPKSAGGDCSDLVPWPPTPPGCPPALRFDADRQPFSHNWLGSVVTALAPPDDCASRGCRESRQPNGCRRTLVARRFPCVPARLDASASPCAGVDLRSSLAPDRAHHLARCYLRRLTVQRLRHSLRARETRELVRGGTWSRKPGRGGSPPCGRREDVATSRCEPNGALAHTRISASGPSERGVGSRRERRSPCPRGRLHRWTTWACHDGPEMRWSEEVSAWLRTSWLFRHRSS